MGYILCTHIIRLFVLQIPLFYPHKCLKMLDLVFFLVKLFVPLHRTNKPTTS